MLDLIAQLSSMKYLLFTMFLLVSFNCLSQTITGKIIDSLTNSPIEYANVVLLNRDYGTYSNENGVFTMDTKGDDKKLVISAIGYCNKQLDLEKITSDTLTIALNQKIEQLEEVLITTEKATYSSSKTLGLNQKLKIRTSLPFGYEFTNLIKNPFYKSGILETVIISLNKATTYDYLASYNIKFYEYNEETKQPGDVLYYKNLIVTPENKTYKLKIDVSDLKIPFSKNGICIGVEIINTQYDTPIKTMAQMAPKINFTHTKAPTLLTWSRYRNKNWKIRTRKSHVKKGHFSNGGINVNVNVKIKQ